MNTLNFLVAVFAISVITFVSYIQYRKEINPELPSGMPFPTHEELFSWGYDDYKALKPCDLYALLNHAYDQLRNANDEEKVLWGKVIDFANDASLYYADENCNVEDHGRF